MRPEGQKKPWKTPKIPQNPSSENGLPPEVRIALGGDHAPLINRFPDLDEGASPARQEAFPAFPWKFNSLFAGRLILIRVGDPPAEIAARRVKGNLQISRYQKLWFRERRVVLVARIWCPL